MSTIVRLLHGSRLYGTATSLSDTDFKLVHLPSARDILLQRVEPQIKSSTRREDMSRNSPDDIDTDSYAPHTYMSMLPKGQQTALTMLFVPKQFVVETSEAWATITGQRERWLHRAMEPMISFCRSATKVDKALVGSTSVPEKKWKDLTHAMRVCHEAAELLQHRIITYPRPEAELLAQIRAGQLPYEDVIKLIAEGYANVIKCQEQSTPPEHPDTSAAEALVASLYRREVVMSVP